MIEIVFEETLRGSLSHAQSYGNGQYPGGYSFITYYNEDGTLMTEAEAKAAGDAAEAVEKLRWEKATPLGGNPDDVFNFGEKFNLGDLSKCQLSDYQLEQLEMVASRIKSGEGVRIWYSLSAADQLCSFLWLMNKYKEWALPIENTVLLKRDTWLGMTPADWHTHIDDAVSLDEDYFVECTALWKQLVSDNAPLRVLSEDSLKSADEDYYDRSIIDTATEIDALSFRENHLIGEVSFRHTELSYDWIFNRIEHLISRGEFIIVDKEDSGWEDFKYIAVK